MIDHATLEDFPVCNGKGVLHSDLCPYPAKSKPSCNTCQISDCQHYEECDGCDGTGQMTGSDARCLINASRKLEIVEG
jgi:hypothetical protein